MAQEAQVQGGPRRGEKERDPPRMLAPFIRYLEESGFMEFYVESSSWLEYDEAAACNGIKMQALVMLANRLGLGAPYACDAYLFGPSSGPLAKDARTVSRNRAEMYDGVKAAVPGSFRRDEFEALVRGRDMDWLIAASSFADLHKYWGTGEDLIDRLDGHHAAYTREYLSRVIDELAGAGIIPRNT